ncbi:hypothetical protein [Streptomyces sp. NPDC048442]|uniref:hypothetical protein n=1 Tax=Streptomyces sp. NPDC048442 TaxID=3154823 RepID=UPI003444F435
MPNTTTPSAVPTPKGGRPYPGRPELDAANMRFRRALARLHKEAVRHDPALMPQLAAVIGEATEHLLRLARDAEAAESTSERHRKGLAAEEEKLRRVLRKGARQGNPRMVALLARVDERATGDDA